MNAMLMTLLAVAAVAQGQAKDGEKFPSGIVSVGECPSITPKEDFDPAAVSTSLTRMVVFTVLRSVSIVQWLVPLATNQ